MTEVEAKNILKELKELYPTINKIEVEYHGSGDSFDDFYNLELKDRNGNFINNKELSLKIENDSLFKDLLWFAIEQTHADFNNEGSEGSITLNLKKEKINIKNYYIILSNELSDDITI